MLKWKIDISIWVRVRVFINSINNKLAIGWKTSEMFSNIALLSLYENTIDVNILKYPQKIDNVTATKQSHIYSSEIFITIFTT